MTSSTSSRPATRMRLSPSSIRRRFSPTRKAGRSMPRSSRNVLIVDDQPSIRRVVRAYLETVQKCHVTEAENGVDAIKKLIDGSFDVIITDLVMPEMTGLELLGYVRRHDQFRHLPVIMLTSQGD